MKTKALWAVGVLAVLGVQAATPKQPPSGFAMERALGPDLLTSQSQRQPPRALRPSAVPGALAAGDPTVDEVGDIASFGRNVRWLGVQQMNIDLLDTCPPDPIDGYACQPLAASGTTGFAFDDVARFVLPAKATKSILCHWFSPFLSLGWSNPGAGPELGTLTYTPTLTVENPVLDDPALINPQTGLPFGGSLLTGMTSSERIVVPLSPGMAFDELRRDTATCIAGFVSRRGLIGNYGLSEAQADEFFKQPTVVRMNIQGAATNLAYAQMVFGLRIVGD
jgi:hypothetical protein